MEENQTIAVIMSAYNEQESWLRESIESILNQTYEQLKLYIVLDKPENEQLCQVMKEYEAKDKRVVCMINPKNLGLVGSLNRLLGCVEEEYVARMDADDVADHRRLELEMEFLQQQKLDFVMAGADFLYENGTVGPGDEIPQLLCEKMREVLKYGNVSIHSTWLLKRTVYEELGGYREVKYCEDLDLVLRALQGGFRVGRMREHLLRYRLRNSSVSMSYAMEQVKKAEYLRENYQKGLPVLELDVTELNRRFGEFSEKQKNAYAKAKILMDDFCDKLYRKRFGACIANMVRGMAVSGAYRRMFIKSVTARIRINRIYQA